MTAIDVTRLVDDICAALSVAPNDIRSVELLPNTATVVTYTRNDSGSKFIGGDGQVATDTHTLEVSYS